VQSRTEAAVKYLGETRPLDLSGHSPATATQRV
jgi:hypothetical protein